MTGIFLGDTAPSKIFVGDTEVSAVYVGDTKVRPTTPACLCFTAEQANSTVQLAKYGTPTVVSLEKSTDGSTWSDYTIGDTITLSSMGDKVYMRNKSDIPTGFSSTSSSRYHFELTGLIAASGDITYLLCKNGTDTIQGNYCFYRLFSYCSVLTTAPSLPATTLTQYCYGEMFSDCANLTTIPALPATTLEYYCYSQMFNACYNIKLSNYKTGEYQTPYSIPTEGTGTDSSGHALDSMFSNTGGTFAGSASVNTTYYTSNTVV